MSTATASSSSPKIEYVLRTMSVADLVGQMSQIDINVLLDYETHELDPIAAEHHIGKLGIGSVLNLPQGNVQWDARKYRSVAMELNRIARAHNRPPVLWGLDSGHGANYIRYATLTPQPLNLAATFNVTAAYQAGVIASRDTRAAGIAWIFGPLADVATHPAWPRVYETLGEDPLVVGTLAAAMVKGMQQKDGTASFPAQAAASVKHFIGYPTSRTGKDRGPAWIPRRHLYQYFVRPWQKVIDAGAKTIMGSYTEVDGIPVTMHRELVQTLLRDRMGFKGVLVTDYEEVYHAWDFHHVAPTKPASVLQALAAASSLDVSMIPWDVDTFTKTVTEAVELHGTLNKQRLQTSVRRMLYLKESLGLMKESLTMDEPNLELVGTDREQVYEGMVQDSLVLVENNGVLPLNPKESLKIAVTGPTADSMGSQCGAWTRVWGGTDDRSYYSYGSTVWDSMQAVAASHGWEAEYSCGVDIDGNSCQDQADSIAAAVEAASKADVTFVCLGEAPYAEKQGDIDSLQLPIGQNKLVEAIRTKTSTKIVMVYFGGRPRTLPSGDVDAVLLGFLPGPDSGRAVADIVTGVVNPNGRLPITYPANDSLGGIPYWHAVSDLCMNGNHDIVKCAVAWPFGHGLSYTSFEYANFKATGGIDTDLTFTVTVKNTGTRAGAETVLFFTFDEFRSVTPEYKQLRAFDKVFLSAGESITVSKVVPVDELRFVGAESDQHYVLDPTMVAHAAVGYATDCRQRNDNGGLANTEFCIELKSQQPEKPYLPVCDSACQLWESTGCTSQYDFSHRQCLGMCSTAQRSALDHWDWDYVNCLERFIASQQPLRRDSCWKMTSLCMDIFTLPDGGKKSNDIPASFPSMMETIVPGIAFSVLAILLFCSSSRCRRRRLFKIKDETHKKMRSCLKTG